MNKDQEQMYSEAFNELGKLWTEIDKKNKEILLDIKGKFNSEFINSLEIALSEINDLPVHESMNVVDSPEGDKQTENWGCIDSCWVDQYSQGIEGDSYTGYVYIALPEHANTFLYLKIPFNC